VIRPIQENPTARTERRNRWLMAALGLAVIAGGTIVVRRVLRRPAQPV
jgi:hypothetical protein